MHTEYMNTTTYNVPLYCQKVHKHNTHTHTHTRTHIHTHTHTHTHTRTHTHIHTQLRTDVRTSNTSQDTNMSTYVCMYVHTYVCISTVHTCINIIKCDIIPAKSSRKLFRGQS